MPVGHLFNKAASQFLIDFFLSSKKVFRQGEPDLLGVPFHDVEVEEDWSAGELLGAACAADSRVFINTWTYIMMAFERIAGTGTITRKMGISTYRVPLFI